MKNALRAGVLSIEHATLTVRANWRIVFRFEDGAKDVDYLDYH